jgi:hypothetical protein
VKVAKRSPIWVTRVAEGAGSQLCVTLPAAKGRELLYSLRGSIEYSSAGKSRPSSEDKITIVRAYGTARLSEATDTAGAPREMAFQLAKPIRTTISGKAVTAQLELSWPELLTLRKYRAWPGPGHPFSIRPVSATLQLQILWRPGLGGLAISGHGRIPIPTISPVPLLAACMLLCCCPPEKPKCRRMCLDIKVGPKAAGGPVMTKDEVKAVIKRVNEIWGCTAPGQCCIEFTVADGDIHLTPAGLKATVKVKEREPHDEHKQAVKIARSATCYNVYYVENMEPVGAAAGKFFPGMTLKDENASVLVQYPPGAGYTNETLATVTAHELGHALGLAWDNSDTDDKGVKKHSSKPTNLMHNVANLGTKLNADQCAKATHPLLKDAADDCESKPAEV